jgi:hypothetical protein
MRPISEQVVVITGASSGIGRTTVQNRPLHTTGSSGSSQPSYRHRNGRRDKHARGVIARTTGVCTEQCHAMYFA